MKYYCLKCRKYHNSNSKIGKLHLKYRANLNPSDSEIAKAIRKRIEFHGMPPDTLVKVPIESRKIPEVLVVLGELVALEYRPITPTGKTTKKKVVYRHEMGDIGGGVKIGEPPLLCSDPEGKNLYIIKRKGTQLFIADWIYG